MELEYCPGRPVGSTEYEEKKINKTQRLTPKGHAWIKNNRKTLEKLARENYEIQFKL